MYSNRYVEERGIGTMSEDLDRIREQEPDRRRKDTAGTAAGMTLAITAVAIILAAAAILYWLL